MTHEHEDASGVYLRSLGVVDANVFVAAVMQGEAAHAAAISFFQTAGGLSASSQLGMVHVPEIWFLECAGALNRAAQKGRLQASDVEPRLDQIEQLVRYTAVSVWDVWAESSREIVRLALCYRCTVPDACYLYLAKDLAAPLITCESPSSGLPKAARAAGVAAISPADWQLPS